MRRCPTLTSADLRPSSAHIWENCSGAPLVMRMARKRAEVLAKSQPNPEKFLRNWDSSADANRGTCRHADIASALTGVPVQEYLDRDHADYMKPSDEEIAAVQIVIDEVRFFAELGGYDIICEEEFPLKFRPKAGVGVVELLGHIDILLINDQSIVIVDYKNGVMPVELLGNPQLELYALAVRAKYPNHRIDIAIIQPNAIGGGGATVGIQPIHISGEKFSELEAHFAVAVARCHSPVPEYTPGPWCHPFCPGLHGYCPAILQRSVEAVAGVLDAGDVETIADPPWWLLDLAPDVVAQLKKLGERADKTLMAGGSVPGWRLEESFGNRKWIDKDETAPVLAGMLDVSEDAVSNTKVTPIGIVAASKLAKQKGVDITGLIEQPTRYKRVRGEPESDPTIGFGSVE